MIQQKKMENLEYLNYFGRVATNVHVTTNVNVATNLSLSWEKQHPARR